jgi:hypothetical protein
MYKQNLPVSSKGPKSTNLQTKGLGSPNRQRSAYISQVVL